MLRYKNKETLHPKTETLEKQNGVHCKWLFEGLTANFLFRRSMFVPNPGPIPVGQSHQCFLEMGIDQYFL